MSKKLENYLNQQFNNFCSVIKYPDFASGKFLYRTNLQKMVPEDDVTSLMKEYMAKMEDYLQQQNIKDYNISLFWDKWIAVNRSDLMY